jgi:hypothetical protein
MDFVTGPDGLLTEPHLYDGAVLGVRLVDKTALHVNVQTAGGQPFELVLAGLQRLRCDGFAEANTIYSVEIVRNTAARLELLYRLVGEPPAKEPYRTRHDEWMAELNSDLSAGRLALVSLEPSYGCAIMALCETVRIVPAGA